MFTIIAIVLFLISITVLVLGFVGNLRENTGLRAGAVVLALLLFGGGYYFQTHKIVQTQYVGVSRNALSQELYGPYNSGVIYKPFFGSVHYFPASSDTERCEQYTPAIKGSYGITLDLCFYYNTQAINWLDEINRTGSLDAGYIMNVWRNSIVGDVARSVKNYTPEQLSDNRSDVEQDIFTNVSPWFNERGISLVRVSFKNWDFTSPEVAQSFDQSIVSQRKITEQTALLEAAKISRERELYEAETAQLVAEQQREALDSLGLSEEAAVQYLWIKLFSDSDSIPNTIVIGSDVPVAVPTR
jgi:hypothetical protein